MPHGNPPNVPERHGDANQIFARHSQCSQGAHKEQRTVLNLRLWLRGRSCYARGMSPIGVSPYFAQLILCCIHPYHVV